MQRKLTVIFSADVVGYSALMERDEAGTLARLKENRASLFDPRVAAHGGRIFKLMGDGVLIEFSSAAAAVTCALEIQRAMEAVDAERPDAERLRYRVGINLGDVIIEGDDIYGEGVNVAARLQALAPVGGIAISRNVSDQVSGKVAAEFDDLGPHTVKNIERPVHVFAVRGHGAPSPSPAAQREKSQRTSICVLPFNNMSGDSEQEYFSDGISEDIITDLSKVSALSVTARNTCFTFKGKHVDVPQVARQLKVDHVLEGSVRKSGNRVRITAQLINGRTGDHIWAERYDRDLNDIFALQDEISEAIVAALRLHLLPEEKKAIERRGTSDPEAYKLYLMARQYSVTGNAGTARANEAIIRLCTRATEIDPNYALAWALLASAEATLQFHLGQPGDKALEAAERAISLDPSVAEAHGIRARVLTDKGRNEEALHEIETALRLDPESYEVNQSAAHYHHANRQIPQALAYFEKAASSLDTDYTASGMVVACYQALKDTEGARPAAKRAIARIEKIVAIEADNGSAMSHLVNALLVLGEVERAKAWMERAMLLDPTNRNMAYNFACALINELHDIETGLDIIEPGMDVTSPEALNWVKSDPDMDAVRDHPRFKAMMAKAEARHAAEAAAKK